MPVEGGGRFPEGIFSSWEIVLGSTGISGVADAAEMTVASFANVGEDLAAGRRSKSERVAPRDEVEDKTGSCDSCLRSSSCDAMSIECRLLLESFSVSLRSLAVAWAMKEACLFLGLAVASCSVFSPAEALREPELVSDDSKSSSLCLL
jgi:hypothetical protein